MHQIRVWRLEFGSIGGKAIYRLSHRILTFMRTPRACWLAGLSYWKALGSEKCIWFPAKTNKMESYWEDTRYQFQASTHMGMFTHTHASTHMWTCIHLCIHSREERKKMEGPNLNIIVYTQQMYCQQNTNQEMCFWVLLLKQEGDKGVHSHLQSSGLSFFTGLVKLNEK